MTRRNGAEMGLETPPLGHRTPSVSPTALPQRNLMVVAWRGRWLIVLGILLGLGGGWAYLSQQTPIFASSSRILVEQDSMKMIDSADRGQTMSGNFLQTQCELIQSNQILSPVAELPEVPAMKTFTGTDNPIGVLKMGVGATAGIKDDLITVTFESPYPEEAANLVNAVVASYETYYRGRRKSSAKEVLEILTSEKRTRDNELRELSKKMLEFKQKHPSLSFQGENGNLLIEQLSKVTEALGMVRLEVLQWQAQYESAKSMASDPLRIEQWLRMQEATGSSPLQNEIQKLDLELATLKRRFGADHPNVRIASDQLDDMRSKLGQYGRETFQAQLSILEGRLNDARFREKQFQTQFDSQKDEALALNFQAAEYGAMQAEYSRLEKLADLLDTRIKELNLTERADPTTVTVLEPGRPSPLAVKPKHSVVLFQALLIGLLFGGGLAYLRDWMDQRITSVEEVQARLGLNVLGVLPHMNGRETPSVRGQKVQLEPMSDIAEAYRTIRTAIYFGAPDATIKTILVTSPAPGDGKTTSASNLAIAMAQAGQRVLLIDCDFRKPMQHKIFGIEDGIGVTNVVAGQISLSKAVKPTGTRGLYVLPSGPTPANPSEILNGRTFATLLAKLKDKFDHVVIDSPPVMPVTDARILGASADITILVVRAMKSTRRISEQATQSLLSVGSRMLGVIVNDAPRRRSGYGYYQNATYRYGYGTPGPKSLEGRTNGARLPTAAPVLNGH